MTTPKFSDEQLIAYAAGELDRDTAGRVQAFLAQGEARLAERIARIRTALHVMRTDDTHTPTADALERHKGIFEPGGAGSKVGWLENLRRAVADLVFDSRVQPALAGFRGEGSGVQLAYECPEANVELQFELLKDTSGERWQVTGQISSEEPVSELAVGFGAPGETTPQVETSTDEFGVFSLGLDAGVYDVLVRMSEGVVVVPRVTVGR